jgi:ribosome biogenesis GTPase A
MRVRYSFSCRKTRTMDLDNKHKVPIPQIVREVINKSDIVLEVLDSRFPEETRNLEIEKMIRVAGKKIVYVFNKSDLTDRKKPKLFPYVFVSCRLRTGIKELRNRITIEAKKLKQDRVSVGVIGYPNTGKSSLINTLTGRSSAKTAAEAGFTKGIQKIRLKEGLILLDTPGLISESENSTIDMKDLVKHSKIGVRTFDKVKDPEFVVFELMKQYPGVFDKFFEIDSNNDIEILLEKLGRKMNCLKKGNQIDKDRVSRQILKLWQEGTIRI